MKLNLLFPNLLGYEDRCVVCDGLVLLTLLKIQSLAQSRSPTCYQSIASDTPHGTPHIHSNLLDFLFQLPPVAVVALLNPHLKLSVDQFHLLPVPISEAHLLLIQEDLDVSGDPGFNVSKKADVTTYPCRS